MSGDQNPRSTSEDDAEDADEWLSSSETIRLIRVHTLSPNANYDLAKRAHAGLLRARAATLIVGGKSAEGVQVPKEFWWAGGDQALAQNWALGDFETWIDHKVRVQAFGVRFLRADVQKMIPGAFKDAPFTNPSREPAYKAGRPPAEWWDDMWIDVCRRLYDGTLQPKRQADLENAMNEWIARSGYSAATSTVRSRARKLWLAIDSDKDEK